ncbi:hypothetical protein QR680_006628 [Steinernema hermaphroditum]|uniref:Coatomer subunit delta n=1 Tax=Steinernema hermaphroditum TaxID=289476 RepID=A0AA39HW47_9BILA|nr:hypothetical protein QR680_006628 [Steinernema hermaphroditum]
MIEKWLDKQVFQINENNDGKFVVIDGYLRLRAVKLTRPENWMDLQVKCEVYKNIDLEGDAAIRFQPLVECLKKENNKRYDHIIWLIRPFLKVLSQARIKGFPSEDTLESMLPMFNDKRKKQYLPKILDAFEECKNATQFQYGIYSKILWRRMSVLFDLDNKTKKVANRARKETSLANLSMAQRENFLNEFLEDVPRQKSSKGLQKLLETYTDRMNLELSELILSTSSSEEVMDKMFVMTIIAASIIGKSGKALVSRQFGTETPSRTRMEGFLETFPKLVGSDKSQRQHTYIDAESIRYVYQPMDNIYMVLITTRHSNIIEDLETLRLFSRVIPEYCRTNDEKEIMDKAFELIFAFDEIVALGRRENVNLAQIRTFTEMDSHEERVFKQIQEAQARAAIENAKEKEKQFKKERAEMAKKNIRPNAGISSATSISSSTPITSAINDMSEMKLSAPKPSTQLSRGGGRALKLGAKTTGEDTFLQQLQSEGQAIVTSVQPKKSTDPTLSIPVSDVKRESVHIRFQEKFSATVTRDGGLESGEIQGTAMLNVSDSSLVTVQLKMSNRDQHGATPQVHPNLDKKLWQSSSMLKLKNTDKPFPCNVDVGVLKWRLQLADEEQLPITINCWPNENPDGCSVSIEYTLQTEQTLKNVTIAIPLPPATVPVISECDGSYEYIKSKSQLQWTLPVIDESNKTGTLEFTTPNGHADHFFPVNVSFYSPDLFCNFGVEAVQKMNTDEDVPFSSESRLIVEKYDVV